MKPWLRAMRRAFEFTEYSLAITQIRVSTWLNSARAPHQGRGEQLAHPGGHPAARPGRFITGSVSAWVCCIRGTPSAGYLRGMFLLLWLM